MTLDINAPARSDSGIFGLDFDYESSGLVLVPVPWDVTTSYRPGTSLGPAAILKASRQLDLFDRKLGKFYESGIHMLGISAEITDQNQRIRKLAEQVIRSWEIGAEPSSKILGEVNEAGAALNAFVRAAAERAMDDNKKFGIIGGDHSVPLGAISALGDEYEEFGILHFDAHHDLRQAYEGFEFSHASIMFNVLREVASVKRIVQVGIRDFCEEEVDLCESNPDRLTVFYDQDWKDLAHDGRTWKEICARAISALPKNVYISFDIDALNPALCPNTGTPVPGGLDFHEATYMLHEIVRTDKNIIGFDLCEVNPGEDEWDANVGMRILWKLCGAALSTGRNG